MEWTQSEKKSDLKAKHSENCEWERLEKKKMMKKKKKRCHLLMASVLVSE